MNNEYIKDFKSNDGKIIGFYCSDIPEELIHAAGFLPYRIRGSENFDFNKADALLSKFNCSFIRSTLNNILNERYSFLDGFILANTCDHVRRIYDILKMKYEPIKKNEKHLFFISLPHTYSLEGLKWIYEEILQFKNSIEHNFKINIGIEEVKNALNIYEENKTLLSKINEFRTSKDPKLTGTDFIKITISNNSVRKEFANLQLKEILRYLEEEAVPISQSKKIRARLMLVGSSVDNPSFIEILEHAGGIIVADNLCTGSRNFLNQNLFEFSNEANIDKIPTNYMNLQDLDSLIWYISYNTYNKILCPRMMNAHQYRLSLLKEFIKKYKIQGIILQRIEFCDLHGVENGLLAHEIQNELGLPIINLDREYFLGDTGRLKTRIEAFLEKIE